VSGDGHGEWDAARLAQVVSNLVDNALTHGDRDEPVRVSVDAEEAGVRLKVMNRGPVVPPELMPELFEPFRRGVVTDRASRSRGLGLGLYIVKAIVAAHGGTIDVHSTIRDGTMFSVRLPRIVSGRSP
jgi:signal transduction histidine kinase